MVILRGPSRSLPPRIRSMGGLLERLLADPHLESRVCAIDAESEATLSFGELARASAHIARAHIAFADDTRIGICMNPSLEAIITVAGIVRRGLTYVALDPSLPPERLAWIARDSGIDIVLGEGRPVFPTGTVPWRSFHDVMNGPAPSASQLPMRATEEDAFCILYTSGSAGKPKGVRIPHRAVLNRIHWQWASVPFDEAGEVACAKTSLAFVDSIAEWWAPLLRGVPLVTLPKRFLMSPEKTVAVLQRFHVTRLILVPSLLRVLVDHILASGEIPTSLKHVVASGEVLPPDLGRDFFRAFDGSRCTLSNYYGSTEVMGDVLTQSFRGIEDIHRYGDGSRVAIGRPIDNTTLILHDVDAQGVGEMVFAGAGVASGYLGTPAGTNGPGQFVAPASLGIELPDAEICFRTGDRGKLLADGSVVYVGRDDSQVKIAGNRFALDEVEAILRNHCACKQPVVALDGDTVVAFLSRDEQPVNLDRASMARWLPGYAIPRIVRVDELPFLPGSGKIDRQRLLQMHRATRIRIESTDIVPARRALIEVMEELGIEAPSDPSAWQSDFFAVGGTSMNAISAICKLRSRSFDVSMESFLAAASLEEIVATLALRPGGQQGARSPSAFDVVPAAELDEASAIRLVTASFLEDETLLTMLHGHHPERMAICDSEMKALLRAMWPYFLHDGISFGIERQGQLAGICLNLDEEHPPQELPNMKLVGMIVEFLTEVERVPLARLLANGTEKVLHGFVVAVARSAISSPAERVRAMLFMEEELIRRAREKGYRAIIATNTNELTQDTAEHVLGYTVEAVVDHLADWASPNHGGARPFSGADPQRSNVVKVCAKRL
ncbi:AMP-binding protein [Pendulispora brunnea]|uniref:AMP-binding protein n=1 Tax=Pendulispora brunnea TaxID=2905690 RepID=A0ABZ2JWX1_9BACT